MSVTSCNGAGMSTTPHNSDERVAFTFEEVARKFGKDRSWVYREFRKGNFRAITGFGTMMISAAEIERVLAGKEEAGE